MKLADGTLWPIPGMLEVSAAFASKIGAGSKVASRDPEGVMLAVMTMEDLWRPDRAAEAELIYEETGTHLRIGLVADETIKNRRVVICAPVAPYEDIRQQVRKLTSSGGEVLL